MSHRWSLACFDRGLQPHLRSRSYVSDLGSSQRIRPPSHLRTRQGLAPPRHSLAPLLPEARSVFAGTRLASLHQEYRSLPRTIGRNPIHRSEAGRGG